MGQSKGSTSGVVAVLVIVVLAVACVYLAVELHKVRGKLQDAEATMANMQEEIFDLLEAKFQAEKAAKRVMSPDEQFEWLAWFIERQEEPRNVSIRLAVPVEVESDLANHSITCTVYCFGMEYEVVLIFTWDEDRWRPDWKNSKATTVGGSSSWPTYTYRNRPLETDDYKPGGQTAKHIRNYFRTMLKEYLTYNPKFDDPN